MTKKSIITICKPHSVFISYSWDSDEHKEWVMKLAEIIAKSNVQVVIDENDFLFGDPLPQMMEEAISKCEYVLFVCTPNYKKKSDSHKGGVYYEDTIIGGEIYEQQNHRKFIPVFCDDKNLPDSTPKWATGKLGCVFEKRKFNKLALNKLIKTLGGSISEKELNELITKYNKPKESPEKREFNFDALSSFWKNDLLTYLENRASSIDINDIEDMLLLLESIEKDKLSSELQTKLAKVIEEYEGCYSAELSTLAQECFSFD